MTSVTSSRSGNNYIFALPTLDISGDFDERPTFEVTDAYSQISADVETTTTIDISASHMKKMFQVFTDSDSFNDLSANDFYYRTRGGPTTVLADASVNDIHQFAEGFTLTFGDQTCDGGAHKLTGEANIKVNEDYARHLAQQITGTIRGVDLFSNETDVSNAWVNSVDASVLSGYRTAFANHNEWKQHAASEPQLGSPAQHILSALLKDASGVERVLDEVSGNNLDYDLLAAGNDAVVADLSGRVFELPLVSGDVLVTKVVVHYKGQTETGDAGNYQVWDNNTAGAAGLGDGTTRDIATRSYLIRFNLVDDI